MTGETETRLTESVSAQVTEDIEITVTEGFDASADEAGLTVTAKIQHAVPDRGRARDLFERLATLRDDDEERLRIRGELVELHLPLVEYLARRFRNRGEWLDDLTQVATIGLIKSIDRSTSSAAWSSPPTRRPRSSARSSVTSVTRAGRCGCRAGSRS